MSKLGGEHCCCKPVWFNRGSRWNLITRIRQDTESWVFNGLEWFGSTNSRRLSGTHYHPPNAIMNICKEMSTLVQLFVVSRWTHRTCHSFGFRTHGRWYCPGNRLTFVEKWFLQAPTLEGDRPGWIQCNPRWPGVLAGREGLEEHSKQLGAGCEAAD